VGTGHDELALIEGRRLKARDTEASLDLTQAAFDLVLSLR